MTIFIDADASPVVRETVEVSTSYGIPCYIFCDFSHEIYVPPAKTIVVGSGPDAVDFALLPYVKKGDLVITQDYGLAAIVLAKNAEALHHDGKFYDPFTIDFLLARRHSNQKKRRAGIRTKGPKKRTKQNDDAFVQALTSYCKRQKTRNT